MPNALPLMHNATEKLPTTKDEKAPKVGVALTKDNDGAVEKVKKLHEVIDEAYQQVERAYKRKVLFLAIMGPMLALVLCIELLMVLYLLNSDLRPISNMLPSILFIAKTKLIPLHALINIATAWLVTIIFAVSVFCFVVKIPIWQAKEKFEQVKRLNRSKGSAGRRRLLKDELNRLSGEIASVYFYYEDKRRYNEACRWRSLASDILEQYDHKSSLDEKRTVVVGGDEYDLTCVEDLISSIEASISNQERVYQHQRIWRNASLAIVFFYSVILLTLLGNQNSAGANVAVALGVPAQVLLWSAIGSIACVLYRLFAKKSRVNLQQEIRWLIARPIIGIIMGALSFLAVEAGLILLGTSPTESPQTTGINYVYLVIAFVAGFSDKFYLKVIDVLVGRIIPGDTSETDSFDNKIDRPRQATQ